jgi:cytochrome c
MPTPKAAILALSLALIFVARATMAEGPHLGKPIEPGDIVAWDISIPPDGTGLPPGSGTSAQGAALFAQKCALCHGENGKGGHAAALVGGGPITDVSASMKTIANFWPYATTVFDYIRRAMPWQMPRSLTRGVRLDRIHSRAEQDHRRGGRDERDDAAQGADAQSRWFHCPLSGQNLIGKRN